MTSHERGDSTQAVQQYRQALQLKESAVGPDHISTARTLNNLGLLNAPWPGLALLGWLAKEKKKKKKERKKERKREK
jgi:hypothetical protein